MKHATDQFVSEMNSWHNRTLGLKAVEALKKNHFDAAFFEKPEEVVLNVISFTLHLAL